MKQIIYLTLILLSLNTFSQKKGWLGLDNSTLRHDYQKHAVGGMALGVIGYQMGYYHSNGNRRMAVTSSIASVAVISILKEKIDHGAYKYAIRNGINHERHYTPWDGKDILWTVIGATVSTIIHDVFFRPNLSSKAYNKKLF